jgi:hypothetical protein
MEKPPPVPLYYDEFIRKTNNGRVFELNLSSVDVDINKLTEAETTQRQEWATTLEELDHHYLDRRYVGGDIEPPAITSQEMVLQQRIVAPKLGAGKVSTRSRKAEPRKGRMYPPTIAVWNGFKERVQHFVGSDDNDLTPVRFQVFAQSLLSAVDSNAKKEIYEQQPLVSALRANLVRSGLIDGLEEEHGGIGKIDFSLIKPVVADPGGVPSSIEISVVCESKSTHNLLLPVFATEIVSKYNAAAAQQNPRTTEWSNIAHPLAQLVGYMASNQRCYGALTSGTRTYFVCVDASGTAPKVQITDAWFLGEPNYLRAWAYMHRLGCEQSTPFKAPKGWLVTSKKFSTPEKETNKTPEKGTKKKGKRGPSSGDGKGIKRSRTNGEAGASGNGESSDIPHVAFDDVEILGVIGTGRNGAAFRVCWNGQQVAMKQFDVGKDGEEGFNKELGAYVKLQKVWGTLVPKPMFLSESISGGVCFLGLQLGRDPIASDDVSLWNDVLKRLEKEFGIRHNDAVGGRNRLFITDGEGSERLVAIDFEDWDDV